MSVSWVARRVATLLVLGLIVTVSGATASAQTVAIPSFTELDINEDGILSGKEMASVAEFDTDGDKRITLQEFADGVMKKQAADGNDEDAFNRADINEDGFLSGTEKKGFEQYDTDRNGEISKQEYLAKRLQERGAGGNTPGLRAQAEALFKRLDGNNDGRLSGTEMQGYAQYDANGDGRITLDEFVAMATGQGGASPLPPNVPGQKVVLDPPVLPTSPRVGDMGLLIQTIRSGDAAPLIAKFHPDLNDQVDEVVFDLYLACLSNTLGEVIIPGESQVKVTSDNQQPPTITSTVEAQFANGKAPCTIATRDGKVMSFFIDGPDVTAMIYQVVDKSMEISKIFAASVTPASEALIRDIQAGEYDAALDCFHPEARKQIDNESTRALFRKWHDGIGDLKSVTLGSLTVNYEKDVPQNVAVEFDVTGSKKTVVSTLTFQFVGLRAWIVGYEVRESTPVDPTAAPAPAAPAAPAPAAPSVDP